MAIAKSLLMGINVRRLLWSVGAVFLYIVASDMLIHGALLGSWYQATATLWRPEAQMQQHFSWMLLSQFLIAKFLALVYAKGYQNKGRWEGVRFGLFVGPLIVAPNFGLYAVVAWPLSLILAWVGLGIVQVIGAGVLLQWVYRR